MKTQQEWRGIIPPLLTPLLDRDSLDRAGLAALIEHVIGGGVHGIFILGTTGEAPSLGSRLQRELITATTALVAKRVPVLVGITHTSFVESIALATHAEHCKADAVVLAPPFYFPAGQPELLDYLQHLTPELPLPILLYNMPSHTKLAFDPETVEQAADLPGIVGLKDSSGNMSYFHELLRRLGSRPDFALFVGPEQLLAESILFGGRGGICGGANLFPRLYVKLYEAAGRQDWAQVRTLHERVMQVGREIYAVGRHASSYIKGLKCALALKRVCSDCMAEPFQRFQAAERAQIVAALGRLEVAFPKKSGHARAQRIW